MRCGSRTNLAHIVGSVLNFAAIGMRIWPFLWSRDRLEQFNAWLAQQVSTPAPPSDLVAQQGEQVFLSHTCVMCHAVRGSGSGGKTPWA